MPTPSPEIIQLLSGFAAAMTAPTFAKSLVLIYGAILAPGTRTVSAILRVMGLRDLETFVNYHRVLNCDRWSPWVLSKLLLVLLIRRFVSDGVTLVVLIDETLERREGKRIKYKGRSRDALRSTVQQVVTSLGIRWCYVALLVSVPWNRRPWALPFYRHNGLSPKTSAKLGKTHRTSVDRAMYLIEKVRRWQPEREIVLVGDGSYAAVALIQRCQRLKRPVRLISRLRLDAALHDDPVPPPKSMRGPKPQKGVRQPNLATRVKNPSTIWQRVTLPWYSGKESPRPRERGLALVSSWHATGPDPLGLGTLSRKLVCANGFLLL